MKVTSVFLDVFGPNNVIRVKSASTELVLKVVIPRFTLVQRSNTATEQAASKAATACMNGVLKVIFVKMRNVFQARQFQTYPINC